MPHQIIKLFILISNCLVGLLKIIIDNLHVAHLAFKCLILFVRCLNLVLDFTLFSLCILHSFLQSLNFLLLLTYFPGLPFYQCFHTVVISPLFMHLLIKCQALILKVALNIPDFSLVILCTLCELIYLSVFCNHIFLERKQTVLVMFADLSQFNEIVLLELLDFYSLISEVV